MGGCFVYRVVIPFNELKRFGVEYVPLPELPNDPFTDDFAELCRFMDQFDLIVVQRCYKYHVVKLIKSACEILGKKMIFETDDDYFHLPPSNPCYPELAQPNAIAGYIEVLKMADAITVSTKELKDVLYPFNKNIHVFANNVESIFSGEVGRPARAYSKEVVNEEGKVQILNLHGLSSIPAYWVNPNKGNEKGRVVRIGYSGTPSHREDWETIRYQFEKLIKKYESKIWIVFIGDKYFYDKTVNAPGRKIHVPVSQYQMYLYHLRNVDIGLAPLTPNMFNMSKSPIKAIEYAMWGVPAVLPHYVTYTREFTSEVNCLTYYNGQEWFEAMEELINNQQLRENMGQAARDHVAKNRLEKFYAQDRYDFYASMVAKPKRFFPVPITENPYLQVGNTP